MKIAREYAIDMESHYRVALFDEDIKGQTEALLLKRRGRGPMPDHIDVTPKAKDAASMYWTDEESKYYNEITSHSKWLQRPAMYAHRMMEEKFGHNPEDCWKTHNHKGELAGTPEWQARLEAYQATFLVKPGTPEFEAAVEAYHALDGPKEKEDA